MAKFYGSIGFAITTETSPGVWTERIVEYPYAGDVFRDTRRMGQGESIHDNLSLSSIISIIADPFANQNIQRMRFLRWMGANWKITNVEVQRPRLLLYLGEVYNG
jgi:hypothetical protein